MEDRQFNLKAVYVLRENIRKLLEARHEDQQTLARWCRHDKSWINKFLNEGRGVTLKDFDKIASFFGVETYQLFQPGISTLTERRSGLDRRSAYERRVGHAGRQLAELRTEVNKHPAVASSMHGTPTTPRPSASAPEVRRILERAAAELFAVQSGQQTPTPRARRPKLPRRDRPIRRSDPTKT
jgi:hypothetical protein